LLAIPERKDRLVKRMLIALGLILAIGITIRSELFGQEKVDSIDGNTRCYATVNT